MASKKWKTSYDNNRKYSSKWEERFVWVQKAADGTLAAYCKLCHCNIVPRLSSLSNHEKSEKHKQRTPLQGQKPVNVTKTPRQDNPTRPTLSMSPNNNMSESMKQPGEMRHFLGGANPPAVSKEMILIDPRVLAAMKQKQYVSPDTLNDNLRDLDNQMQQVLAREDLSQRDKARLYQHTLQRYLTRLAQYRHRPLGLVDITTPPPPLQPLVDIPPLQTIDVSPLKAEETDKSLQSPSQKTVTTPQVSSSVSYKPRSRKKTKIPWENLNL